MMKTIYDSEVDDEIVTSALDRLTNQTFRLLPANEEGEDWIKPIQTIIIEIAGLNDLFPKSEKMFSLLCKMQGLLAQGEEVDFQLFRRCIFECCSMFKNIKNELGL